MCHCSRRGYHSLWLWLSCLIQVRQKEQPNRSSATRIFFYYCNQLEDNTSHKHHCSFSENGKQNKTTFIYFLPRYWTTLIFTCSDEIGLEIILWQYDCTIRRESNIYWKNKQTKKKKTQHLGVLRITSHRSITVLHFDISNLWLSNIQLRQSPKNNGSIVDNFVREKTNQKMKMRIKKHWQIKKKKRQLLLLRAFHYMFGRFERNSSFRGIFRQWSVFPLLSDIPRIFYVLLCFFPGLVGQEFIFPACHWVSQREKGGC